MLSIERRLLSLPIPPFQDAAVECTRDPIILPRANPRFSSTLVSLVRQRTGNRVAQLVVEMHDDVVRLSGHCESFHVKQLAQHAVMDMVCGATIENRIVVEAVEFVKRPRLPR